ncbi:MAG: exodeoxyribonuclease VII large subunit [Deltaproteobacteria bacterium]|nr:exodeoxyribonuclease VII large subunit [Deltaproteobacteria bacterium]
MGRPGTLTVTELTRLVKGTLEAAFPPLWVEGEIADFRPSPNGHLYLNLKDKHSQLRVVMFRREASRLPFIPGDGMQVLVFGTLGVYESRGVYQLIAMEIEPRGLGALREAMDQLRKRLESEGLFSVDRKRPLPSYPKVIGVVTSPTGAAVRDILRVFYERGAFVNVILSPALVQGAQAPASIVAALEAITGLPEVDVIIIGRGGGSFEDLLAFSDERVVRAVASCPVPVISAVGHEIDTALTDLGADFRAPTPSAAAEMVAKSREEVDATLSNLGYRLGARMHLILKGAKGRLSGADAKLVHPRHILEQGRMRIDDLTYRLTVPIHSRFERHRSRLQSLEGKLDSLGPRSVLDRGYAVVRKDDGSVVIAPHEVKEGEMLTVDLSKGRVLVRVVKKSGSGI